jgi:hypothetical protein
VRAGRRLVGQVTNPSPAVECACRLFSLKLPGFGNRKALAVLCPKAGDRYRAARGGANARLSEYGLAANPPRAARAYALQSTAFYDAYVATFDGKYAYWAIRPFS